MIASEKKAANAVGGTTARACDSCLKKRARWFCAADDAFLCQSCDVSVHSANRLASRHERVRLRTASLGGGRHDENDTSSSPQWLRGLTRKARTPRHNAAKSSATSAQLASAAKDLPFVPEMSGEGEGDRNDEIIDEHELLYLVPVFDPFSAEPCVPNNDQIGLFQHHDDEIDHEIQGFLQSETELAELAADVESLLGVSGFEEDRSCCIDYDAKNLGLMGDFQRCKEEDDDFDIDVDLDEICGKTSGLEQRVKVEEDDSVLGFRKNPNFESELSPETNPATEERKNRDILLRLNYEAVIEAWDGQTSPWMTGIRPEVKPENGWPDCMDMNDGTFEHGNGDWRGIGSGRGDGGREARVSRYREKRRTRLFSKKIRYEVRKLNAEKRPRMKGRFVKRTSFMGITNNNNNNINPLASPTFPYQFMKK